MRGTAALCWMLAAALAAAAPPAVAVPNFAPLPEGAFAPPPNPLRAPAAEAGLEGGPEVGHETAREAAASPTAAPPAETLRFAPPSRNLHLPPPNPRRAAAPAAEIAEPAPAAAQTSDVVQETTSAALAPVDEPPIAAAAPERSVEKRPPETAAPAPPAAETALEAEPVAPAGPSIETAALSPGDARVLIFPPPSGGTVVPPANPRRPAPTATPSPAEPAAPEAGPTPEAVEQAGPQAPSPHAPPAEAPVPATTTADETSATDPAARTTSLAPVAERSWNFPPPAKGTFLPPANPRRSPPDPSRSDPAQSAPAALATAEPGTNRDAAPSAPAPETKETASNDQAGSALPPGVALPVFRPADAVQVTGLPSSPLPKARPKKIPARPAVKNGIRLAAPASDGTLPKLGVARGAAPHAAGGADGRLDLSDLALLGVFGPESKRRALIRLPSGEMARVTNGQSVAGWKVERIARDGVRLRGGAVYKTLKMPN